MFNDKEKIILNLMGNNKSKNEILNLLNISNQEFYDILLKLKGKGIDFYKKYFSNGEIKYGLFYNVSPVVIKRKNFNRLNLVGNDNESITMLFLSDPHYGSGFEFKDIMDMAYEYCAKKGIHVVVNTGDNVDGVFSKVEQSITDPYEQVGYFLENYPQDDNIITFTIGGDHDYSLLRKYAINLLELIENNRHDIVPLAFNEGFIKLKEETISLRHYFPNIEQYPNIYGFSKQNYKFYANGHFHSGKVEFSNYQLNLLVPSMSRVNFNNKHYNGASRAYAVTFNFNGNYFDNVVIEDVSFDKKVSILMTYKFPLSNNSTQAVEVINLEDLGMEQEVIEEDSEVVNEFVDDEKECEFVDDDVLENIISLEELEDIRREDNRKKLSKYISIKGNIKKSMPLDEFRELLAKCGYNDDEINVFMISMGEFINTEQFNLRVKNIISLLDKQYNSILQRLLLFIKKDVKDNIVSDIYLELKEFIVSDDFYELNDDDRADYTKSILEPLVDYFGLIEGSVEENQEEVSYKKIGYIRDNRGYTYIENDIGSDKKHIEVTKNFFTIIENGYELPGTPTLLIGPDNSMTYSRIYKGYYYVYTTVGDSYIFWGTWARENGFSEYNKRWSREDCVSQLEDYKKLILSDKFNGEVICLSGKKKKVKC